MQISSAILVMAMIGVAAQCRLAGQSDWDRSAAAKYLDDRIDLWFVRARQLGAGEGKVACVSCHTVVPYLLARPALRKAMRITQPASQEARLLDNSLDMEQLHDEAIRHESDSELIGLCTCYIAGMHRHRDQ